MFEAPESEYLVPFDNSFDVSKASTTPKTNGHLHKGFKPVHWCLDCGSALAEAEVAAVAEETAEADAWQVLRQLQHEGYFIEAPR